MHLLYALQTEAYETARSSLRAGVSEAPSTLHHDASLGGYLLARLFIYWTLTCCYRRYPLGAVIPGEAIDCGSYPWRQLSVRLPPLVHSYLRSQQLSIKTAVDPNGYYFWGSFLYLTLHLAVIHGQLFLSALPAIPIQRNLPPTTPLPHPHPIITLSHCLSQIPPQPRRP